MTTTSKEFFSAFNKILMDVQLRSMNRTALFQTDLLKDRDEMQRYKEAISSLSDKECSDINRMLNDIKTNKFNLK